jgi:SAM-dependent methyltransferase
MVVLLSPDGASVSDEEFAQLLATYGITTESIFRRHEFNLLIARTRGVGVDVGCGLNKIHANAVGVNHLIGPKDFTYPLGAQLQGRADDLPWFRDGSLDYVFSSHCLEHTPDPERTLREWTRVLRPGGQLVLLLPHKDIYPRVGTPGANPDHKVNVGPDDMDTWTRGLPLRIEQVDTVRRTLASDPLAVREAARWGHPTLNFSFEFVARKVGLP